MIGITIYSWPIEKGVPGLWWIIGYGIKVVLYRPMWVRLQSRKDGRTKKGKYHRWRNAGDSFKSLTIHEWFVMRKGEDRGKYKRRPTFKGKHNFQGQVYTNTAVSKCVYTKIITLDFK